MAITEVEELKRLVLQEGWVPYFHKGVRRWYLRNGRKTEIVSAQLESYAQDLAAHIPPRRNKVTPELAAEVVERRRNGELIGSIAEQMSLPYRTVENVLDRYHSGMLELPNPTSMAHALKGESPPAFNLPKGGEEKQLGNPLDPVVWPLLAVGAVVGIGVGATLIDKFLGSILGWNLEAKWWWERVKFP